MQSNIGKGNVMNFKVGDRVTPLVDESVPSGSLGRIFIVRKVNPKNLRCSAEDGGTGINFPAEILLPATDDNVAAGRKGATFGVPYRQREFFANGDVVTLNSPYKDITTRTPLIVTRDDGRRTVHLVKLGGDGSRYLKMGPGYLVKHDLAWLAEELISNA